MNKICSKCGLEKALTEFYKNCRSHSGYRSDCKTCHTSVVRRYQATERGTDVAMRADKKRTGTLVRKTSHNRASATYKRTSHGRIVENASSHRRRERKHLIDTAFSMYDAIAVYARFNHQCFVCGSKDRLSIDHHRPLVGGHALTQENAVLLCVSCNASKGTKMPDEFYVAEQLEALRGQGVI